MKFEQTVDTVLKSSDLLSALIDDKLLGVEPLAGGNVSPVYRLIFADGMSQVLKFAEETYWLQAEKIFLETWASCGIRTPCVIKQGVVPTFPQVSYLLMEYLPGENLFTLMESGQLPNPEILRDLGRILARMHEPTTKGYGKIQTRVDGQIRGKWDTFTELLTEPEWVDAIDINVQNGDLNDAEIVLVPASAEILEDERRGVGGSYAHNDFRAGNILYKPMTSQPYAVIDPGAEFTHPYLCLAYSLLLEEIHGRNDPQHFQAGYEEVSPLAKHALHAALFLKSLQLLPRWGRPEAKYAQSLHALFARKKSG